MNDKQKERCKKVLEKAEAEYLLDEILRLFKLNLNNPEYRKELIEDCRLKKETDIIFETLYDSATDWDVYIENDEDYV
jgi:hypothetical protein